MARYSQGRDKPLIALAEDDVHVWQADLDLPAAQVQRLERALAPDELARADRFRAAEVRARFVVTRGALRDILGRYLGLAPEQVRFGYGPAGKPLLAAEQGSREAGGRRLEFNLAHSGGVALFAVARGRRVGVDVELIRPNVPHDRLAARFFSPQEQAQLRALPAEAQLEAFFACWTRKEAFVKARGEGLALGLTRFAVSVAAGGPAALLHTAFDPDEAGRWALQDLAPRPGYAAALAVEGRGWQLTCWRWPDGIEVNRPHAQFAELTTGPTRGMISPLSGETQT